MLSYVRIFTSLYWVIRDLFRPLIKSTFFRLVLLGFALWYLFSTSAGAFSLTSFASRSIQSDISYQYDWFPFDSNLSYDYMSVLHNGSEGRDLQGFRVNGNYGAYKSLVGAKGGILYDQIGYPYGSGEQLYTINVPPGGLFEALRRGESKGFSDIAPFMHGFTLFKFDSGNIVANTYSCGKKYDGYIFRQIGSEFRAYDVKNSLRYVWAGVGPSIYNGSGLGGCAIDTLLSSVPTTTDSIDILYMTVGEYYSFSYGCNDWCTYASYDLLLNGPLNDTFDTFLIGDPTGYYGNNIKMLDSLSLVPYLLRSSVVSLTPQTPEFYEDNVIPVNNSVQNSCQKYSSIVEKQIMRLNLCRQRTAPGNIYGRTGDNEYETMFLDNYTNWKNYPPLVMEQNPNNPFCRDREDNQRILYEQQVGRFEGKPEYTTGLLDIYKDTVTQQIYIINNPGTVFDAKQYCNMNSMYLEDGLLYERTKQLGFIDYMASIIGLGGTGQSFYDDADGFKNAILSGDINGSELSILKPITSLFDKYFKLETIELTDKIPNMCVEGQGRDWANLIAYGIMLMFMLTLFRLLNK